MKYLMKWIKLTKTLLLIYNLAFGKKNLFRVHLKNGLTLKSQKKLQGEINYSKMFKNFAYMLIKITIRKQEMRCKNFVQRKKYALEDTF